MDIEEFVYEIEKLGISCDDYKLFLLEKYCDLLLEWNSFMNLTAITDRKDIYLKHFYDSLTICKVIDLKSISSICDVGTGAGFPGIVLKIFFPHIELTLVDALEKRIKFLNEVVSTLSLSNVYTVHARAEDYGKINREKFDLVTARAVSSFNILLEYCIPMVKVNSYFVAMRGNDDSFVAGNALKVLSSSISSKKIFNLPHDEGVRSLFLIKKNKNIDLKYPRRNSVIKKIPL